MTTTPDRASRRVLLPLLDTGAPHHGGRSAMTCRFRCGNACAHDVPNRSDNEYFGDMVSAAISRRTVLRTGAAAALVVGTGATGLLGTATATATATANAPSDAHGLTFTPVPSNTIDDVVVPDDYTDEVVIRWGDPVLPGAPEFDFEQQSAEAQAGQFGYNCDFIGFLPWDDRGGDAILWVNHEYTIEALMFRDWSSETTTEEQIRIGLMAHGGSVVLLERRGRHGRWVPSDHKHLVNRRITAETPMQLVGPARGSALLRTSADPTGTTVLGMLNNCAGGVTPWGTILTGEENFNQYFGASGALDRAAVPGYERYGISVEEGPSDRQWEKVDPRFDLAHEPQEPHRFGYIVEIDPYDPGSTPRKLTSLGRFKHEGATIRVARDGRVVAYMGDDERFEYVYKFVSHGVMRAGDDAASRAHNMTLLESGDLYVAKFLGDSPAREVDGTGELPSDGAFDGTGQWLPLVVDGWSRVPGFSVEEVLVLTRAAADVAGATKMDRPEDVEPNPVTGSVYIALTNNSLRTPAEVEEPNPLARTEEGELVGNKYGHVIELDEDADDPTGTGFSWRIFIVCGDPEQDFTYFAGFDKSQVSTISCPDNVMFDSTGNLWIATDGAPATTGFHDGFFAVPVFGQERGLLKQFLTVPVGAEACGPCLSEDERSIFVAVQHPGEVDGASPEAPASTYPDGPGTQPRPSVAVVWRRDGGLIGS